MAYEHAEEAGLPLWCQDEAGPYQALPQAGEDWHPEGKPTLQPHEYIRGGTAKLLTLFHPATGQLRAKGVLPAPNVVLHPWVQGELQSALDQLDKKPPTIRVPLPDDHPLLHTWQHWWWSYERSNPRSCSASYPDLGQSGWAPVVPHGSLVTPTRRPAALYAHFWLLAQYG